MSKQRLQAPRLDARTTIVLELFEPSQQQHPSRAPDGEPVCPVCYAHFMRERDDGSFVCPTGHARVVRVCAPFVAPAGRPAQSFGRARSGRVFQSAGHA
ncbi:hypothetical protein HY480_04270 [Candidatus Uhrbacteria bacterium]|nr:hypothetical protein [Candidatus Uhrbacteria bacterium]